MCRRTKLKRLKKLLEDFADDDCYHEITYEFDDYGFPKKDLIEGDYYCAYNGHIKNPRFSIVLYLGNQCTIELECTQLSGHNGEINLFNGDPAHLIEYDEIFKMTNTEILKHVIGGYI